MKILSIETSCDETAIALVNVDVSDTHITATEIKSELFSQIDIHKEYGGVFPAVAKREHARHAPLLLEKILDPKPHMKENARAYDSIDQQDYASPDIWDQIKTLLEREVGMFEKTKEVLLSHSKPHIDLIAVTQGPGLEPALWVGINFARALSLYWNIPLVPTNHMKGHIFSVLLDKQHIQFPALAFLMSGGHTELVRMNSIHDFEVIGKTKDDAIGESYDKVARMLGFEYPGGPKIAELAAHARSSGIFSGDITLPRPMIHTKDLDFSFSGLKTSVLYKIKDLTNSGETELSDTLKAHIAHEFEEAVIDVMISKISHALSDSSIRTLICSGGVIANTHLRARITQLAKETGVDLLLPKLSDSTDNAQMIAVAGAIESLRLTPIINPEIKALGNLGY